MNNEYEALKEENRLLKSCSVCKGTGKCIAGPGECICGDGSREGELAYLHNGGALKAIQLDGDRMAREKATELLRKIPPRTKHEERTGFNPECVKCLALKAIEELHPRGRDADTHHSSPTE